jgi:hypothetical protein
MGDGLERAGGAVDERAAAGDGTGGGRLDDERLDRAFAAGVERLRARELEATGRRQLWHAHHWPSEYATHCVAAGGRHWCRRCLALYPLGFLVAVLSALGLPPWPPSADPTLIWVLCLPGTVAFVGEAIGVFGYRPRWQVGATLVTALAFGRGLGYELEQRWSPEFWQPVAVFGGIWFLASVFRIQTTRRVPVRSSAGGARPLA